MVNGYENGLAYARMNYIIDVIRGNVPFIKWESLDEDMKKMYMEEAAIAEYVITVEDIEQLETKLKRINNYA